MRNRQLRIDNRGWGVDIVIGSRPNAFEGAPTSIVEHRRRRSARYTPFPIPHSPGVAPGSLFRPGITLLEVLIAVAVLSVGLLSLASLIPVGKYQISEATKLDRSSTLGRAAFRNLSVGGYLRPQMWLYPTQPPLPVIQGSYFNKFSAGKQTVYPPEAPLILDPMLLGANMAPTPNATSSGLQLAYTFPYGLGATGGGGPGSSFPTIPRITLRDCPSAFAYGSSPSLVRAIRPGGADRLFRGTDDLNYSKLNLEINSLYVYNAAGNMTGFSTSPTIEFITANGLTSNAIAMSTGDFSWLVAIQPELSQVWGGCAYAPNAPMASGAFYGGNAATTRQFAATVVVFQKRPLAPLVASSSTPGLNATMQDVTRGERIVWADFQGNGSVRLRAQDPNVTNPDQAEQYLTVRPNQVFMVVGQRMCNVPDPYKGNSWPQTVIQWYQVVTSGGQAIMDSSGQYYRSATVVGDDWVVPGSMSPQPLFVDADGYSYSDVGNLPTGYGVLLTGAMAVYQKTITTDGSSLWSDQ